MAKKRKKTPRKGNFAPRIITKTRWRTRTKGESKRKRARRGRRKSGGAKTAAAVASVVGGVMMGAVANEAGLLQAVPTQNKTGVSLVGWAGGTLVGLGLLFAKSEGGKLLTYGIGGGLLSTELVRQIDMRGYDFDVAFNGAPPLTYDPTPPRQLTAAESEAEDALRNAINIEQ